MILNKLDWEKYPITVLHIDDQRSVTSALKKICTDVPFLNFHACNHAEKAMAVILNIGPTVILMDIHMPIVNGFEILQQLQEHEMTVDIPVLILTMDSTTETKRRAFQLGANDYVVKTPDKEELVSRLRHHSRAYINHLEHEAASKALLKSQKELTEALTQLTLSSQQDALTHIPSRHSFDLYFQTEWKRALRETTALSLILVNIDSFHDYNAFYGALAGDDCLKEVAIALHTALQRPTDLVSRYNNQEFAILLPNTHGQGAMIIAERLRKKIASLNLEHQAAKNFDMVTISLGTVTTSPMIKHHASDFIQTAHNALQEAKQHGRNQVICKSM